MLPLIIAILGLLFPNGIYILWLFTKFNSLEDAMNDRLAVGIFIELVAATLLVAYQFSVNRLGRVRIRWFVILSMFGGLGFGIPAYYWLNKRLEEKRKRLARRRDVQRPSFVITHKRKGKKLKLVSTHA